MIFPLKPNLCAIFNHHVSTSTQTFGLSESELHWIWPHGWLKAIYVQRTAEFHWFPYLLWLRVAPFLIAHKKWLLRPKKMMVVVVVAAVVCADIPMIGFVSYVYVYIRIYIYVFILYTLQHHRCESSITPDYRLWNFGSIIPFPFHQTPKNHALAFELLP